MVRKSGKNAILVANKSEGRAGEAGALEAYALGLGDPVAISAEHGEGLAGLYEALRAALPEPIAEQSDDKLPDAAPDTAPIRIAIVGRPNTGKSMLINRLLGEERLLTGPEAGITRDAIAVELNWRGRQFRVHDTAGLRRRSRINEKLEKLSVADALNAIRFAEAVIVLVDAQTPFEEQDIRIADLVEREGRAIVIAVNKWDLVTAEAGAMGRLRTAVDRLLPQIKGVGVAVLSAKTGHGLERLMQAVVEAHAVWNRRVPTAALNRFLAAATSANPPPALRGRRLRLDYMTQPKSRPPTFVLFGSRTSTLPDAYRRYLVNGLRERFDLPGTPIRLTLRTKSNPYAGRKRQRNRHPQRHGSG
jgi:GTP-binding protein